MSRSTDNFRRKQLPSCLLLLLALTLLSGASATAGSFVVEQAGAELVDDAYRINARIAFRFSESALDALHNGVPLTFDLKVDLLRQRKWLPDKSVNATNLRYQLRYHALAQTYQLSDLGNGDRRNFWTLDAALFALGNIEGIPLAPRTQVEPHKKYLLRLKMSLDIEALPLPLRPVAYMSPSWHLSSGWYEQEFHGEADMDPREQP